jgi:hypothetical protein
VDDAGLKGTNLTVVVQFLYEYIPLLMEGRICQHGANEIPQ